MIAYRPKISVFFEPNFLFNNNTKSHWEFYQCMNTIIFGLVKSFCVLCRFASHDLTVVMKWIRGEYVDISEQFCALVFICIFLSSYLQPYMYTWIVQIDVYIYTLLSMFTATSLIPLYKPLSTVYDQYILCIPWYESPPITNKEHMLFVPINTQHIKVPIDWIYYHTLSILVVSGYWPFLILSSASVNTSCIANKTRTIF